MSRAQRQPSPTGIYHWITRGIHRKKIFHDDSDFKSILGILSELKTKYSIKIYHYCVMDNHVHVLLFSESLENLASFSHFLARRYVYYYCQKYKWIGAVFQGRYKIHPVNDERYLLECGRYIERNPIPAGIALHPEEYPYTSFGYYNGVTTDTLIDPSPAFLKLDDRDEVRRKAYEIYVKINRPTELKEQKIFKLV